MAAVSRDLAQLPQTPASHGNVPLSPLPTPVEAVVHFGYPPDIVLTVYRQLRSGSDLSTPGHRDGHVTAAALLNAVDDAELSRSDVSQGEIESSRVGADEARTSVRVMRGVAATEGILAETQKQTEGNAGNTENLARISHQHQPKDQTAANRRTLETTPRQSRRQTLTAQSISHAPSNSSESPHTSKSTTNSPLEQNCTTAAVGYFPDMENKKPLPNAVAKETEPRQSVEPAKTAKSTADPVNLESETRSTRVGGSACASRERSTVRKEDCVTEERKRRILKLHALRAENRRLKARGMCRHCLTRPVNLTLLPCGHFCFCKECGSSFYACPICRKTVLADVKTFVS